MPDISRRAHCTDLVDRVRKAEAENARLRDEVVVLTRRAETAEAALSISELSRGEPEVARLRELLNECIPEVRRDLVGANYPLVARIEAEIGMGGLRDE